MENRGVGNWAGWMSRRDGAGHGSRHRGKEKIKKSQKNGAAA